MLSFFKNRKGLVAGIDIGTTSVKILETSFVDGSYQIHSFASEALRAGVVEGAMIRDVEAVAASVRRAIINGRIHAKNAIIAVPDSAAITKIIQISSELADFEIEELITFEAEKYFPYPLDEINLDFRVIGPSAKKPKLQDILVVGARTEIVNARVEAIRLAGLEAIVVDVASAAAARAAYSFIETEPSLSADKTIALFHIGDQETNFYVLKDEYVTFTRDEEFGTKQLIDTTMHNYSVSYEEATQMIYDNEYPDDFEEIVLKPFRESLLLQIRRILQFYFSTDNHEQFESILLIGAVAKIKSLPSIVAEKTGIPTLVMNPLSGMTSYGDLNQVLLEKEAPNLLIAAGLSRRERVSI